MPETNVKVTLTQNKVCKACLRYGLVGTEGAEVGSSFYLGTKAYEKLGKPKQITLTISAAK